MKILVTGSGGMLARDLVPCLLEKRHEVLALPHNKLDITDLRGIKNIASGFNPALIINCAAYTRVDEAEKEKHRALIINGLSVQNLCLVCQTMDIPLVHFSTDYVFDGAKECPYTIYDEPNPTSAYGHSKLLGEKYILWLLSKFYLIRTSWLFGLHGKNFIETMLELAKKPKKISVVSDQRGCPTWTQHLAQAVAALIEANCYGIYHITNSEPTTWFDFAREIFCLSNIDIEVFSTTSDRLSRLAKRPRNSVLDPFPFPEILGKEMPSWRQALKEYLQLRNAVKKVGL